MKVPFSWLKDHLETEEGIQKISETLTKIGLEVEEISEPGAALKGLKVAHIIEAIPHPQADRLKVCQVDVGTGAPLQIVCGAPNARTGLKVVLGLPGHYIPGLDVTLKETEIRGVKSFGMLCSAQELNLKDSSEGILELDPEAPIGEEVASCLGLADPVIDVNVTPNRGDCLGMRGVARDLAAAGVGTLKPLKISTFPGKFKSPLFVDLKTNVRESGACPHFMGRFIRGVKNGPSPKWLQDKLKSIGLAPISGLVDITNYICFDLGRPLHVFDADKIKGKVQVRFAREGEKFSALNNREYTLGSRMTVVADDAQVLALGGIIGGLESSCSLETQNIFLEAAYFDPIRIAETGRKLGVQTDSRYRFERGIDPLSTALGIEYATQLILEICGGEVSDIVEEGIAPFHKRVISFSNKFLQRRTGIIISPEYSQKTLEDLGFMVKGFQVQVPSWRPDVQIPEDLVEEVARIYGYDRIPESVLPQTLKGTLTPLQQRVIKTRHLLASRSFLEVVTWSMVSEKAFTLFGGSQKESQLLNSITVDLEYLRPSILPLLLEAIKRNGDRGLTPVYLFEIGPQYQGITPEAQQLMATGVRWGNKGSDHWAKEEHEIDVYDVKNDLYDVLEQCGNSAGSFQVSTADLPSWYHSGRAARVQQGPKNILGYFGELNPSLLKSLGIKGRVVAFEVYLEKVPFPKDRNKAVLTLSPFQVVERDFAFIVEDKIPADQLLRAIKKVNPQLITKVQVFDVYKGAGVEESKKSIAVRVRLEPWDHTLTETEIKDISDKIIHEVQLATKGYLRV